MAERATSRKPAAQHWRDARIAPIHEGTNGIQAIDFVLPKLRGDGGIAFRALLDDIDASASAGMRLTTLSHSVRAIREWMLADNWSPFLTMFATLVAGWLLEPHFPLSRGVPWVNDRRIVSGIIFVIRNGLRGRDPPAAYDLPKKIYNRFIRWSRMACSAASSPGWRPRTERRTS